MTKWKYDMVVCENNNTLLATLNRMGEVGWDAYSIIRREYKSGEGVYIAYLKRDNTERQRTTTNANEL